MAPKYNGLVGTTKTIITEEGSRSLFNGLTAGLHRQILFTGLRVGLYLPMRDLVCGDLPPGTNPALYQKVIAAMLTGAIGITIANPTDVVKVRLQNQRKSILGDSSKKSAGPKYTGTMDCYGKIISQEGVQGLWTSWSANVVRNSVISAAEIASYDHYKETIIGWGLMNDAIPCHLVCAAGAGLTACIFGSPLDVLTTR